MSMRIIGLVLVLALAPTLCPAQSVTVNYNGGAVAGAPKIVTDSGGTPLADGNDVEIGYFDSSFDITNNAGNLSALALARSSGEWHLFGATNIVSNYGILGTSPGSFTATAQQPGTAGFSSHQIDLWVFQTVGNAPPTANLDNVISWGIFSSSVNSSSSHTWTFPPASIGGVDNISTSDVDAVSGILFQGALTSVGDLQLVGVPEPSVAALFGLGLACFGLAARRIRQNGNGRPE
jgi:hypothetical protein